MQLLWLDIHCFLASWQPRQKGNRLCSVVLIHTEGEALCHSGSSSLKFTYYLEAHVGTSIDMIINMLGDSFPTNASFCLSFLVKTFKVKGLTWKQTSVRTWLAWLTRGLWHRAERKKGWWGLQVKSSRSSEDHGVTEVPPYLWEIPSKTPPVTAWKYG